VHAVSTSVGAGESRGKERGSDHATGERERAPKGSQSVTKQMPCVCVNVGGRCSLFFAAVRGEAKNAAVITGARNQGGKGSQSLWPTWPGDSSCLSLSFSLSLSAHERAALVRRQIASNCALRHTRVAPARTRSKLGGENKKAICLLCGWPRRCWSRLGWAGMPGPLGSRAIPCSRSTRPYRPLSLQTIHNTISCRMPLSRSLVGRIHCQRLLP
jgi:hypothetical protein